MGDQQVRAAYNDAAYKNYLNERKIELDCLQRDGKPVRRELPESDFERSETVTGALTGASQYPHNHKAGRDRV